jgi:hypothetical protein
MTQETQTARVHFELVSLGFDSLPTYEFESHDIGRPSGGFICTARLGDMVVRGAPSATKQYAKSGSSVALLELVKQLQQSGSSVEKTRRSSPRTVRPGFLAPEPVVQFGPGEVKEIKDLVRDVGVAYLRDALAFYESRSTLRDFYEVSSTPGLPDTSSPPSVGEVQPASHASDVGGTRSSGKMNTSEPSRYSEELSRLLAVILRHKAKDMGLELDESSYVAVWSLMNHLPRKFSVTDVTDVAESSCHRDGSHRFRIKLATDDLYIRSSRKISIGSPLERTKVIDPNRLSSV